MARALQENERNDVGAFAPIERPRVGARLAASASYPITLIVAPAGYGKSVILRQYFRRLSSPPLRFALRAEHATLLGFLRGLIEALGEQAPHAMAALADAFERSTTSPNRAADLARWMHAHLETFAGVVAIDDLHVADADAAIAEFLVALIERTKGSVRWILATRSTGGLPVGTWLAYRDADFPIDEQILRFTFDEAREAADRLRLSIGDEELGELLDLTEGWPAALSFALHSSTRSSELRNVSALTREMIYRLLAEQIYAALSDDERALLDVAIALPVMEVAVLERAGFDTALPTLERLRERTSFIYSEAPGVYQCHDLFREFLRRQTALGGKRSQQAVHAQAAKALEAHGDIEHAIAAYVNAECVTDVVRLLEAHGFEFLERARADVIARAIDSLDEKTRRENATILGLQGALHATAGKFARAESLFRRALVVGKDDRELVATVSLRLASMLANERRDATELLNVVGDDGQQSASRRVEALSLIAAQRAVAGDSVAARAAVHDAEALLGQVESDSVRARCLHHIGIAFHYLRSAKLAFEVLTQSAELAADLHLYGIASRANAVLSNLALHERDDVALQLEYAEAAAVAATKAGDAFALQTALLQMLGALMRQGEIEKSISIEQQLTLAKKSDLVGRYLAIFRSQRLAWEGRFSEAHTLVASYWAELPYDFDRLVVGSQYALFLALDSKNDASKRILKEMSAAINTISAEGIFRSRSVAVSISLCALAEAANKRMSQTDRLLGKIRVNGDGFVASVKEVADLIVSRLRHSGGSEEHTRQSIAGIERAGYADVALLLQAVDRALAACIVEVRSSQLTAAEVETLQLLSRGLTPKQIALRKDRSVYTVRVHIANAIAKLRCHGRSEAISAAQRMGLL
ncbi:MAG: AAA family ATPase [Candidatus Eremiobacteraeota bacterium]|nr:AAA family ATPase [Candidatus Eremiobacteraeota bacterium]